MDESILIYNNDELICILPACKRGETYFSYTGATYGGPVISKKYNRIKYLKEIIKKIFEYYDNKIEFRLANDIYFEESYYTLYFLLSQKLKIYPELSWYIKTDDDFIENIKNIRNKKTLLKSINDVNMICTNFINEEDYIQFYEVLEKNLKINHESNPTHSLDEFLKIKYILADKQKLYLVKKNNCILGGVFVIKVTSNCWYTFYISRNIDLDKNGCSICYLMYQISLDAKKENVKYIEGNCENYMFDDKSVLIMSHVFEHLYNPNKFLQNCQENNVNEIIISIPNMDDTTSVHITREHTYMYNFHDIVYIYNKYGFTLKSHRRFGFSTFYYFIKDTNIYKIEREIQNERHLYTKDYFTKEFSIPENSYIIGAGFWTQVLIQNIKNKENIAGILDNDKTKQGNYLLGTDYMISPFTKIKDIENPINVIILAKKIWTNEVIDIVHELNTLATIVFLYT
jgi:hypothetical protein